MGRIKNSRKGFTLLELLVVVLIIGILTAIALPQYQIAVKKAQLADYMSVANALQKSEESYFLEHGQYTSNLLVLDISLPSNCRYYEDKWCSVYECGETWYGVCNNVSNVQTGTKESTTRKLRYLQFLTDIKNISSGDKTQYRKGDIVCMAKGAIEEKACMSLGRYEITYKNNSTKEVRYRIIN